MIRFIETLRWYVRQESSSLSRAERFTAGALQMLASHAYRARGNWTLWRWADRHRTRIYRNHTFGDT